MQSKYKINVIDAVTIAQSRAMDEYSIKNISNQRFLFYPRLGAKLLRKDGAGVRRSAFTHENSAGLHQIATDY